MFNFKFYTPTKVVFGGAVPNPRLGLVYEGIELCKKEGVDFILAVDMFLY